MAKEGIALDLSPTKKPLNTQFDELLSPKDTYLIRISDSAHQDLKTKLQQSLELLVKDSTYQRFIYPVLEKLTEMQVQVHDLMKVSNSASFDAIAEPMFAQTLYLELYEKKIVCSPL